MPRDLGFPLTDENLLREKCFINGEWVNSETGDVIKVTNKASGEIIGVVPKMGKAETRRAIEAANDALSSWREKTAKERAIILRRWYELMIENQDDLALLMTAEQGKPLAESKGEILYAASFLEWFAEEGKRVYGDVIPTFAPDKRVIVTKEPIGVVAAITPWNFPHAMITRKSGPAIAAGCTMILKPASATPFSALAQAALADRAGMPPGVFNVVTGAAGDIGTEMTSNSTVRKLTFTGSTEIGKTLMKQCAGTVKKVSMELGGNAPFIVFDDADLDSAVKGAMASKFRNTGQTCVCANRLYVQETVYKEFTQKLVTAVEEMVIGNGLTGETHQGPLIDLAAVEKVEEHIEDALLKGGLVQTGGNRHKLGGTFFEPTVLTGVTSEMKVAREETFGPVAPLFSFGREEEVIDLANDTEFGLASYFYSRDIGRIWRVMENLEYGIIGINEGIISTEVAPFGGVKESGIGREGSKYGIDDFLEVKYALLGGIDA